MEHFSRVDVDDVTIWYETRRIIPESPDHPIQISVKKILFGLGYDLQVAGARQYLEVG